MVECKRSEDLRAYEITDEKPARHIPISYHMPDGSSCLRLSGCFFVQATSSASSHSSVVSVGSSRQGGGSGTAHECGRTTRLPFQNCREWFVEYCRRRPDRHGQAVQFVVVSVMTSRPANRTVRVRLWGDSPAPLGRSEFQRRHAETPLLGPSTSPEPMPRMRPASWPSLRSHRLAGFGSAAHKLILSGHTLLPTELSAPETDAAGLLLVPFQGPIGVLAFFEEYEAATAFEGDFT